MSAFLSNVVTYLLVFIYTVIPTFSAQYTPYRQADDGVKLTVAMMSDTHIDAKDILIQTNLRLGIRSLSRIDNLDALLVDGDMTNYGDEESLDLFYNIIKKDSPVNVIVAPGNHDIGHVHDLDLTSDQARESLIAHYNEYAGSEHDKIYYSTEINGYKFIVLGDEGDHWDECTVTSEQLTFLDSELAEGTKDGKPVFVCCHWPMDGENGEDTVSFHQDGTYADENDVDGQQVNIKAVLEKYKNVFWISGHMHSGLDDPMMGERTGFRWAETSENGVNYVNLPTYGLVNMYGVFWWGTGSVMEVYEDHVTFKGISYKAGLEISSATTTFELV